MSEKIAFVGLGIMGRPMALNLLRSGYPLYTYARREETLQALVAEGAVVCPSPAACAEQASVCITMVGKTTDVESVLWGEAGISQGIRSGSAFIDMSTIHPQTSIDIAEKMEKQGVSVLDAPVSGGEQGAIDGTLSIMVGGAKEVFTSHHSILKCLGKNITYIGRHGAGQVAKACNQLLVAQTITAITEALVLARTHGVDGRAVRQALLGGFANSRALEVHGQRILEKNYQPGFKAELHLKDMNIVADTAKKLGLRLAGAHRARDYLQELVDQGDGGLDSSAMATVIDKKIMHLS